MTKKIVLTVFVLIFLLSSIVVMQFSVSVRATTTSTAMIDLFNQKGGNGPNQPDGYFTPQENVTLYAYVTNDSKPLNNKLVGFEVFNPLNQCIMYRAVLTNASGLAVIWFRIPSESYPSLWGMWTAKARTRVEEIIEDAMTFWVWNQTTEETVGGIYVPVNKLQLLAPYIGLTILLAVAVITVVYVKKRKRQ